MANQQVVDVVDERESGPEWSAWLVRVEAMNGQKMTGANLLHAESCYRAGWSPVRTNSTLKRPDELKIVFDKFPRSAVGKYQLTVGATYKAVKNDAAVGLYSLVDDAGVAFNVSTYGQGYTNGGYWHICNQPSCDENCQVKNNDFHD